MSTLLQDLLEGVQLDEAAILTEAELLSLDPADHLDEAFDALLEGAEVDDFAPVFDPAMDSLYRFNQDHLRGIADDVLDDFSPDAGVEVNNAEHVAGKTLVQQLLHGE